MASSATSPDWSLLPDDLLVDILRRFHTLQDFFSVCAVCQNWRSAATLSSQSPLLLLRSNDSEALYDLSQNMMYSLRLPWTPSARFTIAFSHGHFITVVSDEQDEMEFNHIVFWDLFTFAQIPLPENPEPFQGITLSTRPDSADCLVVLFSHNGIIQYIRVGDSHWTVVHSPQLDSVCNMMFLRGELFALTWDMEVLAVELMVDSLQVLKLGSGGNVDMLECDKLWFGELNGTMLAVGSYEDSNLFMVFLWDLEKKEWKEIRDLCDKALFVCNFGNAMSISTSGLGFRNSCVYYAGLEGECYEFSLKDRYTEVVGSDVSQEWFITPIWVFPNCC